MISVISVVDLETWPLSAGRRGFAKTTVMTDIEGMDQEDHSPADGPAKGSGLVTTQALSPIAGRMDHVFPMLTAAQIARVAAHGRVRAIREGDTLVEAGDHVVPFFLVTAGAIEIVRPSGNGRHARRCPLAGPIQRRGQHDLGAPRALSGPGARVGYGDRARSRSPGDARPDRRRAQRDPDAGVHPAPVGAGGARHRRRRAHRVVSLGGHAAHQGVSLS